MEHLGLSARGCAANLSLGRTAPATLPGFLTTKVLGLARGGQNKAANRRGWVVKNSDVETDASWGSRGVVVGSQYTEKVLARALLDNVPPPRKDLGRNPVLQRFAHSDDLREIWDALAA